MTETYKLEALSVRMGELEALWNVKHDASESFKVACKMVAEQSGLEPAVVAGYVNARMRDKIEAQQRKVEQLQLCFDMG